MIYNVSTNSGVLCLSDINSMMLVVGPIEQ